MEVSPTIEMVGTSFTSPRKRGLSATSRRSQREAVAAVAPTAAARDAVERTSPTRSQTLVVTSLGCWGLAARTSAEAATKLGTRPGNVAVIPNVRSRPTWFEMMSPP
jgi:hypothetical protein